MPRFSIVIPTRNRAYTLYYTLKTCLNQKEFDDYEIVVSDNCSEDNTAEMVKQFQSTKIKYFHTDTALAMVESFNYAVSRASGEYLIIIGSDDAVYPYGLYFLDNIINISNERIIRWEPSTYYWPDYMQPSFRRNSFMLDYSIDKVITINNSRNNIKRILNYTQRMNYLPMLYAYTAVHNDLVSLLISKTGFVFDSVSPDYYSGFAISALVNTFLNVGIPVCSHGQSGASTGASSIYGPSSSTIMSDFFRLNQKYNRVMYSKFYSEGIHVYCDPIICDDFVRAKRNLNTYEDIKIDYTKHIRMVINECYSKYMYLGEEGRAAFHKELMLIKEIIENDAGLSACFNGKGLNIDDYYFSSPEYASVSAVLDHHFKVDTALFGIDNIYDATILVEKLLYNKNNIDIYIRRFRENWSKVVSLLKELQMYKRLGFFAVGVHTEHLLQLYLNYSYDDCTIIKIFDSDPAKWGTYFFGFEILPPQTIPKQSLDALIISSYIYQEEIFESIKQYNDILRIIKLYGKDGEDLPLPSIFM